MGGGFIPKELRGQVSPAFMHIADWYVSRVVEVVVIRLGIGLGMGFGLGLRLVMKRLVEIIVTSS
eukprot:5365414-Pleurochrysis_carterae.AAC.1